MSYAAAALSFALGLIVVACAPQEPIHDCPVWQQENVYVYEYVCRDKHGTATVVTDRKPKNACGFEVRTECK